MGLTWPQRAALIGSLLCVATDREPHPGWHSRSVVLDMWTTGHLAVDLEPCCVDDSVGMAPLVVHALLERQSPACGIKGLSAEAVSVFDIEHCYDATGSAAEARSALAIDTCVVEVYLRRGPDGAWTAEVTTGQRSGLAGSVPPRMAQAPALDAPDLFQPQRLYRRLYDRSTAERRGEKVLRWGDLHTIPPAGEDISNFTFRDMACSLPYCQWGVGSPTVPIHGSRLPSGWRRSRVAGPQGAAMQWEATEPIGVPLKFETVDVAVMGVRRGREGAGSERFSLAEHGFTWVRRGEAGDLDGHRWFTNEGIGAALAGTLSDWRCELWEAGLRELLVARISEELGAPVVELVPLVEDLARRRGRYDAAYRKFLNSPVARQHGIVGPAAQREYLQDRDLDLTTSSCDQREGRATANEHIPMVLELGPVPPAPVENIQDFNRRPSRAGLRASHRAAAWPAHIDLLAEGPTSHLLRAAEVGSVLPCERDCCMPDGEPVPRGVPLRREMMQCWVLRDERLTCMPLALFHDFRKGEGPVAVVPELRARDVVIWRTGSVLHGALTAVAHGERQIELGRWEPLGAVLGPGGVLRQVDAQGRAAAAGLQPGDVLVAINGAPVARGQAAAGWRSAQRAGQASLRLTFLLPRYNGRRSVELRFFVYWPA